MYLSVIIPAYNEAKRIEKTLESVFEYLHRQEYSYEVIVVNDGSTDETNQIINIKIATQTNLTLIDDPENRGKGAVVAQGMLLAKGEYRLFMDADNSTNIDQFENLERRLKYGYEVVLGSRRVAGSQIITHQSWYKELLGRLGNLWIRIFAARGIHDTQAGFKVFTAKAAQAVFSRITLMRWGFDFEAIAIARVHKFKIAEVAIKWINDDRSHVKTTDYINTFFEPLKVRWNILRGKYK